MERYILPDYDSITRNCVICGERIIHPEHSKTCGICPEYKYMEYEIE